MRRIELSDVKAGTYLIVAAEGLKNADGSDIIDESLGVDAFGHKKLAGVGKYVCQELTKRFKSDPDIKEFMEKQLMFVEGVYEIPETRSVTPGHLVRCGHSSAYDVNFGKEIGASAVMLLINDITGVTVVGVNGSRVYYLKTEEAIKQRHVDLDQVSWHENMGTCFGRNISNIKAEYIKLGEQPVRYM